MKIVIAPDSFKESLSAAQAAVAIEAGVRRVLPRARCVRVPMADGGEGTVQALIAATGGRARQRRVTGPLGKPLTARWGLLGDGCTAVVEVAAASGLALVPPSRRDPRRTTSYGTGELIAAALDAGATTVIVGLGGSATNDAGAGMAQALGVRFLDRRGRAIREPLTGGTVGSVSEVDAAGLHPAIAGVRMIAASDVDNPLCGRRGASAVFGPQKGASPGAVRELDAGVGHLAGLIESQLGARVRARAGAGAAGGLGFALMALLGARLRPGVDIVIEATDLRARLRGAGLVITGEGRIDAQTPYGKVPAGVARLARRAGVPVIALGGSLGADARTVFDHGLEAVEAAVTRPMTLDEALGGARGALGAAAARALRLVVLGRRLARRGR